MSEPESADHRVKVVISKGQMFDIGFAKLDGRMQPPRQFYHLLRQVDSDGMRATTCSFGCKSTRPGRDVQQTYTGTQPHGIEKRLGCQGGHRCEEFVITIRQSVVALAFE